MGPHLRGEEHRDRKEKLEVAAQEARAILKQRRVTLDRMETITAFAKDMSGYLRTSELTESRAFIRSFVKEIEVRPGRAIDLLHTHAGGLSVGGGTPLKWP